MIGAVELKRGDTYHRVGLDKLEHGGEEYIVYEGASLTDDEFRQVNESIYTFYPDHDFMTVAAWKRLTRQVDVDVTITVEKVPSQEEPQKETVERFLTFFPGLFSP